MYIEIPKGLLLPTLSGVTRVVEKRSSVLPILTHILFSINKNKLMMMGSDSETTISSTLSLGQLDLDNAENAVAIPAHKLLEIVRNLNGELKINIEGTTAVIKSGKSNFRLKCLPAEDYPMSDIGSSSVSFVLEQQTMKKLLGQVSYAMATSDPRHYLNGACWDLKGNSLKVVSTDGHRLAFAETMLKDSYKPHQVILPRKAVLELNALLKDSESEIQVFITENSVKFILPDYEVITKLIDGKFPEFEGVIPQNIEYTAVVDKTLFKSALTQALILSHEKHKGVRLSLSEGKMIVSARNPESEEAVIEMEAEYDGEDIEMGFNTVYLQEALGAIETNAVVLKLRSPESSILITPTEDDTVKMVVMPMRI
jgi:DNA polymerase-3 subunit beta